jgi:hypothetical protein
MKLEGIALHVSAPWGLPQRHVFKRNSALHAFYTLKYGSQLKDTNLLENGFS